MELPTPEPEPGLGYNEKEPDPDIGHKGKIWGMKRKTFMIVLGTLILLIIIVAAGVGGGVGGTAAKLNAHKGASESTKSNSQEPSTPNDSPYAPKNYKTCS